MAKSYTSYSNFEGSGKISAILPDKLNKNNVYIINNSHILLYDINQNKTLQSFCFEPNGKKNISSVQDWFGDIWIESEGKGICRFKFKTGEIINYDRNILKMRIFSPIYAAMCR